MEPIAIVTALVAVLYIVGRGPLIVAPTATATFYRRMLSTPGRFRLFGVLLVLLGSALIVTARVDRTAGGGGITILIEGFGWFTAAAAVSVIAAARPFQRLFDWFYAPPNEPLRVIGALSVAIGLFWCFVTFLVL